MFYGVTHVEVPVKDLGLSMSLYSTVMGLPVRKRGDGWVDLESGTVIVRLLQTANPGRMTALRFEVPDVERAYEALLAVGARRLYAPFRTNEMEQLAQAADFDGHEITVWRELSEDEYGFNPDLPKVLTWAPDAEELMKSLLRSVPALFRALARRRVVREAEALAGAPGSTGVVEKDNVVRGYILASARITRSRLREPLRKHGYDPASYAAEFAAD